MADSFRTPERPVYSDSSSNKSQSGWAPTRTTFRNVLSQDRPVLESENEIAGALARNRKKCISSKEVNSDTLIDKLNLQQGIYMISGDDYMKSTDVLLKIGKANNLKKRIKNYFLCYPGGFYIYGIILTKPNHVAFESNRSHHKTEQTIHQYLRYLNLNIAQPHGHSGEWFLINSHDVSKVFIAALSVAAEQGLADEPYCYALFPPIFVNATNSTGLYKKTMPEDDALILESKIHDEDRFTGTFNPVGQSARQANRGLSRRTSSVRARLEFPRMPISEDARETTMTDHPMPDVTEPTADITFMRPNTRSQTMNYANK